MPKDSPRIDAYGTIDELNSIVGLARVFNEENSTPVSAHQFLDEVFCKIQDELFDLGSELATPHDFSRMACTALVGNEDKKYREGDRQVPEGSRAAQVFHSSRRRTVSAAICINAAPYAAERNATLSGSPARRRLSECPLKYVNRLSDLFFVLSRWIGKQTGEQEYLWQRGLAKS